MLLKLQIIAHFYRKILEGPTNNKIHSHEATKQKIFRYNRMKLTMYTMLGYNHEKLQCRLCLYKICMKLHCTCNVNIQPYEAIQCS